MTTTLTVKELAIRICEHLKRFERDPKINRYQKGEGTREQREGGFHPYYHAGAFASGRFVRVTYITYQGSTALTKAEAERYLEKLDNGFVGRHFEALRGQ